MRQASSVADWRATPINPWRKPQWSGLPGGRWEFYALDPWLPVAPSAESSSWLIRSFRWEMRSRNQVQRKSGFNIIKWNKRATKPTPRGKKTSRQKTGAQSNIRHSHDVRQRISTGLQTQGDYIGRQTRVTRETQLEPLKQWLSNKMGGDRQSTWEHMAPTNNKPCAQHTETSGGQPGHTSRTVTLINPILIKLTSRVLFGLSGTKLNSLWFWVHISTWS